MSAGMQPEHFRSKQGRVVAIRRASPTDEAALAALIGGLSARSVERRYLTPRTLDALAARREAERLTRAGVDQIVVIAEIDGQDGAERTIVAVAELVRDGAEPEVAEGAVVVADSFQGEGIGRAVLSRLAGAASDSNINRLRAITQAQNRPLRRLIASSGLAYSARFVGAEVLYEVAL
jgi:GNAT superfamily N-acetyltransferase